MIEEDALLASTTIKPVEDVTPLELVDTNDHLPFAVVTTPKGEPGTAVMAVRTWVKLGPLAPAVLQPTSFAEVPAPEL